MAAPFIAARKSDCSRTRSTPGNLVPHDLAWCLPSVGLYFSPCARVVMLSPRCTSSYARFGGRLFVCSASRTLSITAWERKRNCRYTFNVAMPLPQSTPGRTTDSANVTVVLSLSGYGGASGGAIMTGSMNEYRPLTQRYRLAVPYRPARGDWRSAALVWVSRATLKALRGLDPPSLRQRTQRTTNCNERISS